MSCAVFTFLGIYIAESGRSNAWLVSSSVFLAVTLFVVAAYRTWKPEYEARCKAEEELSRKADMLGEILVDIGIRQPYSEDEPLRGTLIQYSCDCANHGKADCEISKVFIRVDPPSGFWFVEQIDITPVVVSSGRAFKFQQSVFVHGVSPTDLRNGKIVVCLIGSTGEHYEKTVTRISPRILTEAL